MVLLLQKVPRHISGWTGTYALVEPGGGAYRRPSASIEQGDSFRDWIGELDRGLVNSGQIDEIEVARNLGRILEDWLRPAVKRTGCVDEFNLVDWHRSLLLQSDKDRDESLPRFERPQCFPNDRAKGPKRFISFHGVTGRGGSGQEIPYCN